MYNLFNYLIDRQNDHGRIKTMLNIFNIIYVIIFICTLNVIYLEKKIINNNRYLPIKRLKRYNKLIKVNQLIGGFFLVTMAYYHLFNLMGL